MLYCNMGDNNKSNQEIQKTSRFPVSFISAYFDDTVISTFVVFCKTVMQAWG